MAAGNLADIVRRSDTSPTVVLRDKLLDALMEQPMHPDGINVSLLLEGWGHMGLLSFHTAQSEETAKPYPEVYGTHRSGEDTGKQYLWNPKLWVERLEGLNRAMLDVLGFNSATEYMIANYCSNMDKLTLAYYVANSLIYKIQMAESTPVSIDTIMKSLPDTFSEFINANLTARGLNQTRFAQMAGVSQSVVSNAVNGTLPIRESLPKMVAATDYDSRTIAAAVRKYGHPKLTAQNDPITVVATDWVEALYQLDRENLDKKHYSCVEIFLLTRCANTAYHLDRIFDRVSALPDEFSPEQIRQHISDKNSVFATHGLDNPYGRANIYLNVWASRKLFT